MIVLLTGFMGVGKTTVGRLLAGELALPFRDLDEMIEKRTGRTVAEIFAGEGEPAFRDYERDALAEILQMPAAVVAAGGGTLTDSRNLELIREHAVSVWLDAPWKVIVERLGKEQRSDRPLYGAPTEMRELLQRRLEWYRSADLHLEIDGRESSEEIVERLKERLEEVRCATS